MTLKGNIAFVTGGGSGLGAAISLAFAGQGARVLVTDVDERAAADVAARCSEITPGSASCRCDVSDPASVKDAFRRLDGVFGAVDILVNNAGIIQTDSRYIAHVNSTQKAQLGELMSDGRVSTHWQATELITDEMFDRMLKIHLYGTFYCTREALPRMRERGRGGRIINMGSIMGTASLAGSPDYCAAKGAILAFTRATAREAATYGVLVNAIAPGFIETPLLSPLDDDTKKLIAMQTPLGRLGSPDDIAAVAVFLAGPGAAFVTGQTISPNGGIYMSQ